MSNFSEPYRAPLSFDTGRPVEWVGRNAKLEEAQPLEVEKLPPVWWEPFLAEGTLLSSVPGHGQLSVGRSRLYRVVH